LYDAVYNTFGIRRWRVGCFLLPRFTHDISPPFTAFNVHRDFTLSPLRLQTHNSPATQIISTVHSGNAAHRNACCHRLL